MAPVRAVLLDFYGPLADLSDPVRSRGFDDFARRPGLPLGPGELYRRYAEMTSSEPTGDGAAGFVPSSACRDVWQWWPHKPPRTEDDDGVWASAAACMRNYLILRAKVRAFRAGQDRHEGVSHLAAPGLRRDLPCS